MLNSTCCVFVDRTIGAWVLSMICFLLLYLYACWSWQSVPSQGMSLHVCSVTVCFPSAVVKNNWDRKPRQFIPLKESVALWQWRVFDVYQWSLQSQTSICVLSGYLCVSWTGDKIFIDPWDVYYVTVPRRQCISPVQSVCRSRAKFGRFICSYVKYQP